MERLIVYGKEEIAKFTRKRSAEEKVGEFVKHASGNWKKDLENSGCLFVLLGVPEDIGVRANYGRAGASTAFRPALESFLNQQNNIFFDAGSVFILGEVEVNDLMEQAQQLDQKNKSDVQKLRELVGIVDERVAEVMKEIVARKKIAVIIGGGHNNAFGNIKGSSEALGKKVNVVNCDPHLDFRPLEGRHSGNGFSYAHAMGYLNKYSVFGMHEQYNNNSSLLSFRDHPAELFYKSFESILIRQEIDFKIAVNQCVGFVKDEVCGIELDLDAITNVPTSAKTSSGLTPLQARQFVFQCASQLESLYFHVAEGAPVLSHIKADNKTGKLISYLVTDFMKASLSRRS
jgi:formiminoglutamase